MLKEWDRGRSEESSVFGWGAIVPHAGWSFSGRLAYRTLRQLDPDCDLVVIIGGHLYPGAGVVRLWKHGSIHPSGPSLLMESFVMH